MRTGRVCFGILRTATALLSAGLLASGCATTYNYARPVPKNPSANASTLNVRGFSVRAIAPQAAFKSEDAHKLRAVFTLREGTHVRQGSLLPNGELYAHSGGEWALAAIDAQRQRDFNRIMHDSSRSFTQKMNAMRWADASATASLGAIVLVEKALARPRYTALTKEAAKPQASIEILLIAPHTPLPPTHMPWIDGLAEALKDARLAPDALVVLPTPEESERIDSFVARLRRDFPRATIALPPFYTRGAELCKRMDPSDRLLHCTVHGGSTVPMGLVVANTVITTLTFTLIPTTFGMEVTVDSQLVDSKGSRSWSGSERITGRFLYWLPAIGRAFAPETSAVSGPKKMIKNACALIADSLTRTTTDGRSQK